jgi:hypothetical protein
MPLVKKTLALRLWQLLQKLAQNDESDLGVPNSTGRPHEEGFVRFFVGG